MSEIKTKKIIRKMISVAGQKEKVPMFVCPAGMSGSGIELDKHFNLEDKQEAEFQVKEETLALESSIKEDISFIRDYQRYRDEGEITSPEVEDFVYKRQATKYYDSENDRNADLTTIFRN